MKGSFEKGMSLLELVIALLLLAIIIVPFAAFYTSAYKNTESNKQYNNALILAREAIEQVTVNDGTGRDRTNAIWDASSTNKTVDGINYTISRTVISSTDLDTGIKTNNDCIPIAVTVTWTQGGKSQSVRVDSLMTK